MNPSLANFYGALVDNDAKKLDQLFQDGFDVNQIGEDGDTPFLASVLLAKPPLFKKILAQGANLDSKSQYNGDTALHPACQDAKIAIVRILLEAGANPNARNNHGQSPLSVSLIHAERKYIAVVNELLGHGADPNEEKYESNLMLAAGNALPECVLLLLEHGAKINEVRPGGTALTSALAYRRYDNAKVLVAKGADPTLGVPADCPEKLIAGKNARDLAVLLENAEMIKLLTTSAAEQGVALDVPA